MSIHLKEAIQSLSPSIVRVIVTNAKKEVYTGTGFFITNTVILTCAHTLLDTDDLQVARTEMQRSLKRVPDDADWRRRFKNRTKKVIIELAGGEKMAPLKTFFDAANDVGILKMPKSAYSPCIPLSFSSADSALGNEVCLLGYPNTLHTLNLKWPFTVTKGIISSHVQVQNGGYAKRPMLQAALHNLPGNSGSPLISLETGAALGFLSGYMNWGRANLKAFDSEKEASCYVPLPVSFVNPFYILRKRSALFRKFAV